MTILKKLLGALALAAFAIAGPAAAGEKPLIAQGGKIKQLPSATSLQLQAPTTGNATVNMPHGTAPTAPTNGDCWTTTAGLFCRINGATVGPYGTGGGGGGGGSAYEAAPTKPVVADFTLENAGTASMADGTYGVVLTMPSSTSNIRFVRLNAGLPGASWSAIMRGSVVTGYNSGVLHHNCIILRNSTNGRLISFGVSAANMQISRWSSYTAHNSNIMLIGTYAGVTAGWKKIESDGTTLTFWTSPNGEDWAQVASETIAGYIGAGMDQVGFGSINGAASGATNVDIFESFAVS